MDRSTLQSAPAAIASARLDLVHPHADHAPAVRESINASLASLKFISWGQKLYTDERALRFCEANVARVAAGDCLIYYAFEKASGRFVGNLDLHTFDFTVPRCQIGYVGDQRFASRGLMREAALTLLQLAFDLGVERVEAWCDLRNTRSVHFAETLGLQYEGLLRSVERDVNGALCDQVLLARLRSDPAPP